MLPSGVHGRSALLPDTHPTLWFFWDDPLLSSTAKSVIENPDNRKLGSIASCWEAAIKAGLKKRELGGPCAAFLNKEINRNNFELLPITFDHATMVETLAGHHEIHLTDCWSRKRCWNVYPS